MKKFLKKTLAYFVRNIVFFILKPFKIFVVYRFGKAIGDQVCMTAIVHALKIQKDYKVIVFSNYSELFDNNKEVWKNINIYDYPLFLRKILVFLLSLAEGGMVENFCFPKKNGKGLEDFMRNTRKKYSLIEVHSLHFREKLNTDNIKPKIYFSKSEINEFEKRFNDLNNFAIIQPVGKLNYTPNKEWGFEKYQDVIDRTKNKINWIQVGLTNETLLKNVKDFRGNTLTLRELAFVISRANFVLSNEGLLNHLSAAVGVKSFVVFSGFSHVELANYDTTIPIVNIPQVECSPCWLLEKCPKQKKWCTEKITIEQVCELIMENQ